MTTATARATIDDLMRTEGKAELIGGRIVEFPMNGFLPGHVAGTIYISLMEYARKTRKGIATSDGVGYVVPELLSGRESFGPDVAYYSGPPLINPMKFIPSPPTLAVEVRSENDYGPAADSDYDDKRADYFEAGTRVVWDVDPMNETVTCYTSANDPGTTFNRGEIADAEPAVPGWRIAVDDVFAR